MKAAAANILVVDDDPDIREVIKDRLESLGYGVSTASRGQECLDCLEKYNPQLILLDIEMPGMSGLDLAERIKKIHPNQPIILVTAFPPLEPTSVVDSIINKPFSGDEIRRTVLKLTTLQ